MTTAISVCTDCLMAIANGEADEEHAMKMDAYMNDHFDFSDYIFPGGSDDQDDDDLGFCTTPCDTCGETLHGDRYRATVWHEGR